MVGGPARSGCCTCNGAGPWVGPRRHFFGIAFGLPAHAWPGRFGLWRREARGRGRYVARLAGAALGGRTRGCVGADLLWPSPSHPKGTVVGNESLAVRGFFGTCRLADLGL